MGRDAGRSVPDGKLCVRHGARRKPCRPLWLLVVAVHGAASTGCSLIYTKGPQPEVQPPPPCTTSNGFPVADAVIAALGVAALTAGTVLFIDAASRKNCGADFCLTEGFTGIGAFAVGVPVTAIFIPSAIIGFNRTAACRAWLEANPQYAPPPSPSTPTSSLLQVPTQGCPTSGDAPRICSSAASWRSSAVVLGDVTSRGGAP